MKYKKQFNPKKMSIQERTVELYLVGVPEIQEKILTINITNCSVKWDRTKKGMSNIHISDLNCWSESEVEVWSVEGEL